MDCGYTKDDILGSKIILCSVDRSVLSAVGIYYSLCRLCAVLVQKERSKERKQA